MKSVHFKAVHFRGIFGVGSFIDASELFQKKLRSLSNKEFGSAALKNLPKSATYPGQQGQQEVLRVTGISLEFGKNKNLVIPEDYTSRYSKPVNERVTQSEVEKIAGSSSSQVEHIQVSSQLLQSESASSQPETTTVAQYLKDQVSTSTLEVEQVKVTKKGR